MVSHNRSLTPQINTQHFFNPIQATVETTKLEGQALYKQINEE
jgi:hypothetical protein